MAINASPLPSVQIYQQGQAVQIEIRGAWYKGIVKSVKARSLRIEWKDHLGRVFLTRVRYVDLNRVKREN